ncbi:MAG: hypothetical protein E6Q97_25090 [Desulfurellales bacterium]|nr:MAG: hypothetical protein E6Q97_25090 [Desulfurellales bacterium]
MPSRRIGQSFRQTLIRTDKRLRAELAGALETTGGKLKRMHEDVVRGWEHQPRFLVETRLTTTLLSATVKPDMRRRREALIWIYVNYGTKPHVIRPRKPGGKLKFQTGYSAKTAPGAAYNVGDGKARGDWVQKDSVNHPGTEARGFTGTFTKQVKPEFDRNVENAIRRAIRRA